MRVWLGAPILGFSLVLSACGGSNSDDGGGGSAGGTGKKLPDPKVYDCRASSIPERSTSIPITCATDRSCTERLVSGHRGAGGQLGVIAPEDTLAGVRAAIAIGADFVETDPRPTKDGVLVNLHDTTVDRTTNGTGAAADLTLAEIQALQIDAGTLEGDFSCERIPTLEQLLESAKGRIHVLLDANKTDRVDLLVAAVQKTETLEYAIFDTDDPQKIQQALAFEPALYTMIRVADPTELDSELALFADHPPVIVELHAQADVGTMVPLVHGAKNRASLDTFGVDLATHFSNDPSAYAAVFENGIDIADTDRPELVLEFLGR